MNSSFRGATASFLAITLSFVSLTGCVEKKVAAAGDSASASGSAATAPASGQAALAAPAPGAPPAPLVQTASNQPIAGQDAANAPPPDQPAAAPMSNFDLVAPIALYPDALLAQVLASATNPQEVLDGGNWLLQNQSLKGDAVVAAAEKAGFTPSMQYLMNFPQVLDNMCQQINWTTDLGAAFKADPKGILDAVQVRRREAQKMGNLATTPQMIVDTKTDNGQQIVEIKPASPTIIYVPQYNPVTVYTTPAPPPTVVVQQGVSTGAAVGIGLLSFGIGMAVGAAINRNNYYPYPRWGYGGMYYGGRPYYPPPYRPVYPGYRPAYGYHPPPNYHWNQYNRQTNITVNNNYYNNFNRNVQNRPPASQLPANSRPAGQYSNNPNNKPYGQTPATRPATANNQAKPSNLQGQYQGGRPNTNATQKPGSGMANANPAAGGQRPSTYSRPTTGNAAGGTRPGGSNMTSRPTGQPTSRPANQQTSRPANQQMSRPTGNGGGSAAKPAARPANNTAPQRGGGGGGKPQGGAKTQGKKEGNNRPKPQ
jgi:hypothetical protein